MNGLSKLIFASALCFILNACSTAPTESNPSKPSVTGQSATPGSGDTSGNQEIKMDEDQAGEPSQAAASTDVKSSELGSLYKRFNEARAAKQSRVANEIAGQILASNPNDVKVLNAMATMAIDQGKYDLARLFLGKVLAKEPSNAAAINNLGVIELKTDNLRLALVQFKKAIAFDSGNKSAHANLGTIYLQYRNYTNAMTELEAAYDHGDKSPETLSNLAFALTGAGRFDRAESMYEKAGAKNTNNVVILLNYAALLIEHANRPSDGLKVLNKIRFIAHEPAIMEKVNFLSHKAEGKNSPEKGATGDSALD